MKKLRKYCLWISTFLFVVACTILVMSFLSSPSTDRFFTLAIYIYTSAAFFASPYMVIPGDGAKTRFDALMIMGSSGFYAIALLIVLIMGLPYLNDVSISEGETNKWEQVAQVTVGVSFFASLFMHCWSTLVNAKLLIFSTEKNTEDD